MNTYFENTKNHFDYDNPKYPGEGDLYDLRKATRDELKRQLKNSRKNIRDVERLFSRLRGHVERLVSRQAAMDASIDSFDERVCVLFIAVADLRNQIAELKAAVDTSEEHVPAVDISPEPEKTRRYNLTDEQIDAVVSVLRLFADAGNWKRPLITATTTSNNPAYFRFMDSPWKIAEEALRKAGIE